MADILRGNFIPKKKVIIDQKLQESLEDRFEKEAMKRVGGSICFVSKQKVKWDYKKEEKK